MTATTTARELYLRMRERQRGGTTGTLEQVKALIAGLENVRFVPQQDYTGRNRDDEALIFFDADTKQTAIRAKYDTRNRLKDALGGSVHLKHSRQNGYKVWRTTFYDGNYTGEWRCGMEVQVQTAS